jgi:hypothetical protein
MLRREEWQEQIKLAVLLDTWLDPACTFWTATDPVAPTAMSGFLRKRRGVKPGVPDILVWYRRKSITIELKSQRGQCSPSQRAVREALLRAGSRWWVCRSAEAAMWALYKVPFRVLSNDDGSIVRWQQPELPAWEVPKRDPHERRPRAPDYWEPDEAAEMAEPDPTSSGSEENSHVLATSSGLPIKVGDDLAGAVGVSQVGATGALRPISRKVPNI